MKKRILLINGSCNGEKGQSGTIINALSSEFEQDIEFKTLTLLQDKSLESWREQLNWAEGCIFLTGTYWDSWGSPLQYFLEQTTEWEVCELWLGKPAAVIVTMHSVGGKAVLSRLQGVVNTLGMIIPPLCGLVYSLNTHLIDKDNDHYDDFWHLEEIPLLVTNVAKQIEINRQIKVKWQAWDVDRADVKRPWLKKLKLR